MGESQRARWEETTLNTDCAAAATADLLLAASTTTVVALATTARPQRSHTAATVACTAAARDSANHATAAMLSCIFGCCCILCSVAQLTQEVEARENAKAGCFGSWTGGDAPGAQTANAKAPANAAAGQA